MPATLADAPRATQDSDRITILDRQVRELLEMVRELNQSFYVVATVAPSRPREGMIRFASGAPYWNPGSGRGLYQYVSTAWVKL